MKAPNTPLGTLTTLLLYTSLFLVLWVSEKQYVAHYGPIPTARTLINVNSRAYSVFSLLLGSGILYSLLKQPPESSLSKLCANIFHLSKFYEYIDVFLLVAQDITIAKHMAFHHLTVSLVSFLSLSSVTYCAPCLIQTPFYTYFRVLPSTSNWQVFASLNCGHHFLMYAYFGGVTKIRPVLPWTGYIQLIAGIAVDVVYLLRYGISDRGEEFFGRAVSVTLLTTYAWLFTEELMTAREERRRKKRQRHWSRRVERRQLERMPSQG